MNLRFAVHGSGIAPPCASAAALFASAAGLRCGQYLRMLASEDPWRLGEVVEQLRPAPGRPVSPRFRRRARLVATSTGELVFVLPGGGRRWLGGPGEALGVARAEVVTHTAGPVGRPWPTWAVDLRDREGRLLARLLWAQWCAGDDGAGLRRFCAAVGIDVAAASRPGVPPPDDDLAALGTSATTRLPRRFLRPPATQQLVVVNFASVFAGLTALSVPTVFDGAAELSLLVVTTATFAAGVG